jgi:hypothetical protein
MKVHLQLQQRSAVMILPSRATSSIRSITVPPLSPIPANDGGTGHWLPLRSAPAQHRSVPVLRPVNILTTLDELDQLPSCQHLRCGRDL